MTSLFDVNVDKYSNSESFQVFCVCTLKNVRDNAVTFISLSNIHMWEVFKKCRHCLIFWPESFDIPNILFDFNHVIIKCPNPHLRYCQFFEENKITNIPDRSVGQFINGAWISTKATIGNDSVIMPGAYIGGNVVIGKNCYIGCGVKMVGEICIGDNVIIRENTVIGADGLTTDRDESGKPVHMPQFGGVRIGNNVQIGANVVIARGAIDDTIIGEYSSIDNCSFISHNVCIGKRTFIVGETIMFGSSVVGDDSFISGNSTIRNGVRIGNGTMIGMGSVVVKDVSDGQIVKGNPAK